MCGVMESNRVLQKDDLVTLALVREININRLMIDYLLSFILQCGLYTGIYELMDTS